MPALRLCHTAEETLSDHDTVVCPLLCKNGGLCLQKDRCLCPPNFTGKFCQIPVSSNSSHSGSSSNHSPASSHGGSSSNHSPGLLSANQELTRSEFVLPLGPNQETQSAGAPSPHMVKVRVQHPPEASVRVHQVLKVPGSSQRSGVTSGSAGFPAPVLRGVQAQTVTGGGTYTQHSGFKYCFREVSQGQCSSPLPGLRSRETCCRGVGKAWGLSDCELCPKHTDRSNSSCPVGFEKVNGTKCEDVNECDERGRCENGLCVNTRGSYSCVCSEGFILDATHGLCISAFKEICPAGPGYHYSASALQFTQRALEQLGHRGAPLLPHNSTDKLSAETRLTNCLQVRDTTDKLSAGERHDSTDKLSAGERHDSTDKLSAGERHDSTDKLSAGERHDSTDKLSAGERHDSTDKLSAGERHDSTDKLSAGASGTCQSKPGVCGRGLCVNQPMGKHSCVCQLGYELNKQNTSCQDTDECRRGPCGPNSRCENSPGSFTCVCHRGYKLRGHACSGKSLSPWIQAPRTRLLSSEDTPAQVRHAPESVTVDTSSEDTPAQVRVCHRGYKLRGHACSGKTRPPVCHRGYKLRGHACSGKTRPPVCHRGYKLRGHACSESVTVDTSSEDTPAQVRHAPRVCHRGYKLRGHACSGKTRPQSLLPWIQAPRTRLLR
ncbi:hypothetical protein WMY93_028130 [Mugilogobius chulae]|uniref:Uncharacterized protein n=1 Tax=Mugilogobius chulae TaxID=88201 RepID=A0AAW0MTQ6_9GOBI